jgi:hypothetical protein
VFKINYKFLLITSDFKLSSAQGVRYTALYSNKSAVVNDVNLVYSSSSDKLDGWVTYTVRQIKFPFLYNSFNRIMNRIMRIIYPDVYIFRLEQYKRKLKVIFSKNTFENVIIGCTPFSLLLLGKWIKRNYPSSLLIADMSDPFSFNMGNKGRPRRVRIGRYIEKRAFPYFDKIIILNEKIQKRYQQLYPKLAEKFQVVEQGVDEVFINKIKAFSSSNIIADGFTFLYAGGFYKKGRNPNNLYNAFELSELDCKLEIYGNICKSNRPKTSNKIEYHKAVDKMQLAKITAKANALILFDNNYGYQVPGKTIETLASGKPVLFIYNNENSPTLQYVKDASGVVWVKNSVQDIKEGIYKIIKSEYDQPNFDYSPYTWDKMRVKLKNIIDDKVK